MNEFLPDGPTDEASKYGSLEFNEVLDEDVCTKCIKLIKRADITPRFSNQNLLSSTALH